MFLSKLTQTNQKKVFDFIWISLVSAKINSARIGMNRLGLSKPQKTRKTRRFAELAMFATQLPVLLWHCERCPR